MLRATLLVITAWCACTVAVDFEDCGSLYNAISFDLDGCASQPCSVTMGTKRKVTAVFEADFQSETVHKEAFAKVNGIIVDLDMTPEPCADGSGTTCPVVSGVTHQYSAYVTFGTNLVPVRGYFTLMLLNEADTPLACYTIDVNIYSSVLHNAGKNVTLADIIYRH
ncbi:NPC intracellular cholesterol transporter 2 [Periplaneta americana]|uniref:NPC intracellular cholesterol transporter 2 n=1 Tax=Periplaneta americana TaxID=6978 RepID=UPI0037E8ADBB